MVDIEVFSNLLLH